MNWALEGLDRLQARGYFVSPASGAEAVQQMEDLSSPVAAFLRQSCVIGATYEVPVDALWTAWKQWCDENNRSKGTKDVFGRDLFAAVPTLKKSRPRRQNRDHVYVGVGLRTDDEPSEEYSAESV